MSKASAASHHDPWHVADHARGCAEAFGAHIHSARLQDGRCLEELAPQAGLTVAEWEAIEAGQLPLAWEQVLMLATVLRLGRSWMPYLRKLCAKAWGDK